MCVIFAELKSDERKKGRLRWCFFFGVAAGSRSGTHGHRSCISRKRRGPGAAETQQPLLSICGATYPSPRTGCKERCSIACLARLN
ncbi:hypothetical protein CDAR_507161 [Caerostris darwini]|uniref:Uncharacterized protein n=1 Tax=Caerostris darwini TaxID=1538125 RepID=A0AAV4S4D9_9ARAC|nr:hypothetical protein CDAR_507161 [Caerostris darwini]